MHHKFFLSHSLRASSYEPGLGWFSVPHLATAIKCDILSIVLCMLACFWRCKVPSVKSPLPTCKTCHTFILLYSLFFRGGGGSYLLAIWALDSYEEALLAVYSILLLDSVIKSSLPGVAFWGHCQGVVELLIFKAPFPISSFCIYQANKFSFLSSLIF